MGDLEAIKAEFPDTSVATPSCGARATYYVEQRFGINNHWKLDELELLYDTSGHDGTATLLAIKNHLEDEGLFTLATEFSDEGLSALFDSALCIVHQGDPNSTSGAAPDHFAILEKKGGFSVLVDPPGKSKVLTESIQDEHAAYAEAGLSGAVLVVSDRPIVFKTEVASPFPVILIGALAAAMAVPVLNWLWGLRKGRTSG